MHLRFITNKMFDLFTQIFVFKCDAKMSQTVLSIFDENFVNQSLVNFLLQKAEIQNYQIFHCFKYE